MRVTRMARRDPSTACRTPLKNGYGSADGQRSPTTLPYNEKLLFKPVWSPTSMPEDPHFGCRWDPPPGDECVLVTASRAVRQRPQQAPVR
jgi:hypothetical protein